MSQHTFITGQFVRIDQPLANVVERLLAALFDLMVMIFLTVTLLPFAMASTYSAGDDLTMTIFWYLLIVLPILCYHMICEYFFNGQSLGKMVVGLRVVAADGSKPSASSVFLRFLFFLIEGYTGFGLVVMLFTKDNQRLGDIAAGTYVIKTRYVYVANPFYAKKEMFPMNYRPVFPQAAELSLRQLEVIQETYYAKGAGAKVACVELAQKICQYLNLSVSGLSTHQFFGQLIYDYRYMTAE